MANFVGMGQLLTSVDDHTFDHAVVDDCHTVCIYM